jgi:hypothetical protein
MKWATSFAVLALVFPMLLVLVWSGPFDVAFLGAPIVIVAWSAAAVVALVFATVRAVARAWRMAITAAILPVVTLVAALQAETVWTRSIAIGERIHFHAMRNHYLAQVARSSAPAGRRLEVFNWGGFGVSHGVVYDESDEIQLPPERQSAEWKRRIEGTELVCGVWGQPLGDHFYLVRFGC